jgi:hypothetical protein
MLIIGDEALEGAEARRKQEKGERKVVGCRV